MGPRQPTHTWDCDPVGRSVTTIDLATGSGKWTGLATGSFPFFHAPSTFSSAATASSAVMSPETVMTALFGT